MFTQLATKSVAWTALVAGALGVAALITSGTAGATTTDADFVNALHQIGLPVNSQAAVRSHTPCAATWVAA